MQFTLKENQGGIKIITKESKTCMKHVQERFLNGQNKYFKKFVDAITVRNQVI